MNDRLRYLPTDSEVTLAEFVGEAGFISRFKQTWPENAMHFEAAIDDGLPNGFLSRIDPTWIDRSSAFGGWPSSFTPRCGGR